jgi:acyl-CoA thioester hydrolase
VRHSDVDELGHVNNAVYLAYVMEAAYEHAESAGFGLERMRGLGGVFVVRRAEIEYHRPAKAGDELLVTTTLTEMHGTRANRATTMVDAEGGKPVATASTDYVWVGNNGRPTRIPHEAFAIFGME